jgi:ABC-2 type transport system ATP-binding protein
MTAIETDNLTKLFPRTSGYRDLLPFRERQRITAVNGISLSIEEGEFFGLLGPNGAGKTTFIKLLCCLVLPDSGTARVLGHDTQKEEQFVKQQVGLVSTEERSFFWRLTGRQNLEFYASVYNLPRREARKRIDETLNLVGLAGDSDIRFQNYSTGMRQKLAIARGLLSYPRVLFVDEPTRSLDPVSAQTIRTFLKEKVAELGRTVILATHNMAEAEQLCDRLAILDHGKVIAQGTVQELRHIFQGHDSCNLVLRHLADNILPRIAAIHGVLDCHIAGQRDGFSDIEIAFVNRATVLPRILRLLIQSGAEVCDCQLKELPLEEIFVHALHNEVVREAS